MIHLIALVAFLLGSCIWACAQEVTIRPDHDDGIYAAGHTVRWNIKVEGDAAGITDARYQIRAGGLKSAGEGEIRLVNGKASVETTSDRPGSLLLDVNAKSADGKAIRQFGGAVIAPEHIRPSMPMPDDFDAFWAGKLRQLAQIPIDAQVRQIPSDMPSAKYFHVKLNNINGTHVQGQLAVPAKEGKFPAMLIVQNAGVYPLKTPWVTNRAAAGWIAFNIQAHDLPASEPVEFYHQQAAGPLKDYSAIGNTDRETSYFLRMFLGCHRAAEYLTTRPDWDGKTLVVIGASQGGMQAIVTGALYPRISAVLACVPAGCDNTSLDAERTPGWPSWPNRFKGADAEKIKQTARYFDVINFAHNVKCPVLIAMGGIDTSCPPHGIWAAANQLAGIKKVMVIPQYDHLGPYESFWTEAEAWMAALKDGKPIPVEQRAGETRRRD